MRIGSPSALFINPGELARIHQSELSLSANRFSELPSMTVAGFFPSVGTFAAGIGNEAGTKQYSFGYARIISDHNTAGGALNFLDSPNSTDVTLSLGTTFHFMETVGRKSGILVGGSIVNFSSNTSLPGQRFTVGAAYWLVPNFLCTQGSWLYENQKSKLSVGAEYYLTPDLSFQAGTKSFEEASAGLSYAIRGMNLDVAVGKEGISLSVNFLFSEDSRNMRDNYYQQGMKAYNEQEYAESKAAFMKAVEYDEYFDDARTYVNLSTGVTMTATRILIQDAQRLEKEGKILEAKKNYQKVLKSDPNDALANNRLLMMKPALHDTAIKIASEGDNLAKAGRFEQAREKYLLAFEYDEEDESILLLLSNLENKIADSVAYYITEGNTRLEKNQLESAQQSYRRVLRYVPDNPEARQNLLVIEARLKAAATVTKPQHPIKESFDKGKAAFDSQNYLEAITFFTEYLKQDPKDPGAQDYIKRSREILIPQIESYFKSGLQQYVEENYKQALEIWNRALIIKPDHQAILEYKKRAEQKMEALEKLK